MPHGLSVCTAGVKGRDSPGGSWEGNLSPDEIQRLSHFYFKRVKLEPINTVACYSTVHRITPHYMCYGLKNTANTVQAEWL